MVRLLENDLLSPALIRTRTLTTAVSFLMAENFEGDNYETSDNG